MNGAILEHVNITVSDSRKTADLLCQLFGWKIRWHGDAKRGGHTYHVGQDGFYVALYSYSNPYENSRETIETLGAMNHLGIIVDDLAEAERRVLEAGFDTTNHADYFPGKRFYFNDEDGIEYEIVHYPSN